jgi:hypothetical protein
MTIKNKLTKGIWFLPKNLVYIWAFAVLFAFAYMLLSLRDNDKFAGGLD